MTQVTTLYGTFAEDDLKSIKDSLSEISNEMTIIEAHKEAIICNGLSFMRSVTECYGAEKGMELWDQIATTLMHPRQMWLSARNFQYHL